MNNSLSCRRYVSNSTIFRRWVETAKAVEGSRQMVGGNAPVMANRFAMEGWEVLLGANMKQESCQKLHKSVTVSGTDGEEAYGDYHLVMEYDLGEKWGRYASPRANRFIVHNDFSNMMLESVEGFVEALQSFHPSLVIIGGLQMLDNFCFDLDVRTEKIKRISKLLSSLPSSTKIHFEMASFTEERLLLELMEHVIPYADSLGMNEQELADLCSIYEHGNITVASDPFPRVASTLDRIRTLYGLVRNKGAKHGRSLTRIHVHTLAYQAIFITKHSDWQHINSAVAKASLTAYRHVCASIEVDVELAKVIMDDSFTVSVKPGSHRMPLVDSAPVSCWGEEDGRVCVAPNLVCTTVHQTAGGGDNVSAAGLVLQI
jgi:ADP-dependent glucokinase